MDEKELTLLLEQAEAEKHSEKPIFSALYYAWGILDLGKTVRQQAAEIAWLRTTNQWLRDELLKIANIKKASGRDDIAQRNTLLDMAREHDEMIATARNALANPPRTDQGHQPHAVSGG